MKAVWVNRKNVLWFKMLCNLAPGWITEKEYLRHHSQRRRVKEQLGWGCEKSTENSRFSWKEHQREARRQSLTCECGVCVKKTRAPKIPLWKEKHLATDKEQQQFFSCLNLHYRPGLALLPEMTLHIRKCICATSFKWAVQPCSQYNSSLKQPH